jgi:phosphoglycerate dehydrogenase-like enzyme
MSAQSLNIAILYPAYGEFRPAAEREHDLELLAQSDPRIIVTQVAYPAERAPSQRLQDLKRVNCQAFPEMRNLLADAEVVLAHHLPQNVCDLAPRLRWIHGVGAGITQLCTREVAAHGIRVTSSAGANAVSAAEFALSRLLMHWKSALRIDSHQRAHQWKPVATREMAGATIGVIGYGAIGRALVRRLAAFEVTVWVARRTRSLSGLDPSVARAFDLDHLPEFLGGCDAVFAALPDSPETADMFGASAFDVMRAGAFFCNIGRGSLVDEAALVAALSSGRLSGAALDVFREEPLRSDSPLWSARNLMLSPHVAGSPDKLFVRVHQIFRDNVRRYLAGQPLINEVDPMLFVGQL